MNSIRNNRAVAIAGYTGSAVYTAASVANAINGFPLSSLFCGCMAAGIGAVTNDVTHDKVVITDADLA